MMDEALEPKYLSKEEQKAAYDALGLPQETVDLLHDYLSACSNLYGICKVKRVLRLYNKQNEPITAEQFTTFLDVVRQEDHFYYIVGEDELYDGVPQPTLPLERELVAENLLCDGIEDYEDLKDVQADKPFYQPDKEELLHYLDEGYTEPNRSCCALLDFLSALPDVKEPQAAEVLEELTIHARIGYFEEEVLMEAFERNLRHRLRGNAAITYFDLCDRFYDHLRLPEHRGFSPSEIERRMS